MAESGAQLDSGDSDEDRGLQELEMELEKIQAQIRAARKRQDRQQTLRRQIEVARKELATITGDEKDTCKEEDIKVAFTAVVSPPQIANLGAGQAIVFDRVITNIGNAYDNITGIFTAPVRAVYVFEMTLMTDPGCNQYLELVQNGQHIIWNYGQAVNQLDSSSRTVTVELAKGAKVWIRTQNNANHGSGKVHGNGFSTFSGWLYTVLK